MATDISRIALSGKDIAASPVIIDPGQQKNQNAGLQQQRSNTSNAPVPSTAQQDSSAVELAATLSALKAGDVIEGRVEYQPSTRAAYIISDRGVFLLPPSVHLNSDTLVSVEVTKVDTLLTAVITQLAATHEPETAPVPDVLLTFIEAATAVLVQSPEPELLPDVTKPPLTAGDAAALVRQVADYFSNPTVLTDVPRDVAPLSIINTESFISGAEDATVFLQRTLFGVDTPVTQQQGLLPVEGESKTATVLSLPIADDAESNPFRGLLTLLNATPLAENGTASPAPVFAAGSPVTILAVLPDADVLPHIQPQLLGGANLPLTSLVNSGRAALATVLHTIDDRHVAVAFAVQPHERWVFEAPKNTIAGLAVNARIVIMTEHTKAPVTEKIQGWLIEGQHAKTRLHFSLMNEAFSFVQAQSAETPLVGQLPTPGLRLAAQIVLLLFGMKTNKWHTELSAEGSVRSATPGLARLAASIENLAARAAASHAEEGLPQSHVRLLPMRLGDTLVPLTMAVPLPYIDDDNAERLKKNKFVTPAKAFEVTVHFKTLGLVKMNGRLSDASLDIKISSDHAFSEALQASTQNIFMSALEAASLSGKLNFQ